MIILYGSQNGNAKHVANLIQNTILYGHNDKTIYNIEKETDVLFYAIEMNRFDFVKIFEIKTIIFVCSTQGNGTEPFNMTKFWKILSNKNLPTNFLTHLSFAVFGLGDSSYDSYNWCSKKLFNCLIKHGAQPLLRRGCGDNQDKEGFLTDFKLWIKDLYPLISHLSLLDSNRYLLDNNKMFNATLVQSKLLTPEDYEHSTLELQFDIKTSDFVVGDCLAIFPENYNIHEFVEYNNINKKEIICSDFNSIPQQHFFIQLYNSTLTMTKEHKDKIKEIYDNYDLYYEYILLPRRTIFEVIKDFDIKLSLDFIIKNIPTINPRYFTLTKRKGMFYVTISLVSYKTRLKEPRKGLCSEYLKMLSVGETIKVCHVSNKLYLQKNKALFICTGTGITLPRAFINEYNNIEVLVLYGFRYRNKDFLYNEEFIEKNVKMYCAVSRDDKKYVQDILPIIEEIKNIEEWDIFVSGNSRLNKIIDKCLIATFKRKIPFQTETW